MPIVTLLIAFCNDTNKTVVFLCGVYTLMKIQTHVGLQAINQSVSWSIKRLYRLVDLYQTYKQKKNCQENLKYWLDKRVNWYFMSYCVTVLMKTH